MGESKHTPGPWFVDESNEPPRYWIVTDPDTWVDRVASVPDYKGLPSLANARLIAAAPDLLEALKDARFALYGNGPGNPKIDAAIAKAEGENANA